MGEPSLIALPLIVGNSFILRILNHRQAVFPAERIADLRQILCRLLHIPVFVLPLQVGGADDDVIVDVMPVDVCRNDVGELTVGHPGGQLFSDLVCFLRRDLFGFECLPDVIDQNLVFVFSSGVVKIFLSIQHEFINRRFRHAGV